MQIILKQFFKNFFIQTFIKTINYPFQRARTLQQLQPKIPQLQNENLNSLSQCLTFIIKREGEEGIFAGIFYHVHRFFPEQLFSKLLEPYIKMIDKLFDQKTQHTRFFLAKLIGGTLKAGFSLLILYPFDLVQFKLQADIKPTDGQKCFQGIIDCFYQTIQNDGILGLYKGFGTTLAGVFFYRLFYIKIHEFFSFLKLKFEKRRGQPNSSKFLIDFISAITASSLTYPLDTIRKQQMVVGTNQNFIKMIINSITQGRFRDLFRGHLIKLWEGSFPSLLMSLFFKI